MTDYGNIANSEIDPDSPLTTSLMFRLRDNPIAMVEGADGAPRVSRRAIQPGGAEAEGPFLPASTPPTAPGFYEYEDFEIDAPKTFPAVSIIRCNGNVRLADILTITQATATVAEQAERWLEAIVGRQGTTANNINAQSNYGGGGGANIGNGGNGRSTAKGGGNLTTLGGAGTSISGLSRPWLTRRPILGGRGGDALLVPGADGGGSIVLMINGDLDCTGGGIDADGVDGTGGASDRAPGGSAGGSIVVICNGTITGGTFCARGGAGKNGNSSSKGGGGGGGYIALVAAAFAGTQTFDVSGGGATSPGTTGAVGTVQTATLTSAQINGLLLR